MARHTPKKNGGVVCLCLSHPRCVKSNQSIYWVGQKDDSSCMWPIPHQHRAIVQTQAGRGHGCKLYMYDGQGFFFFASHTTHVHITLSLSCVCVCVSLLPAQRSSIKPECLCCTTFGCISVGTPPRTHPRPITKAVSVFPRVYAHAAVSGEVSHCERVAWPCHDPPPPNQPTPQSVGRAARHPSCPSKRWAHTTLAPINRYTVVCLHQPPRCSCNVRAWPQGFHPCVLLTGCSRPYKCVWWCEPTQN